MANEFLSAKSIARRMLARLQNNLVLPALFATDFSEAFAKQGDTIQVARPAVFVADEFDGTINLQDYKEKNVLVTMDKIADVSVEVSSKDLTLSIEDFERKFIEGATLAIAEKINADGMQLYKYVNSFVGASGTTPDGLDDFANTRKILNINKVPMIGRKAIWSPDADAEFSVLDAIAGLDKSGSTDALREGSIGRIHGLENFMSQVVPTHVAGGYTALADVNGVVTVANNGKDSLTGLEYSPIVLTSTAGTATTKLLKGDILTVDKKQYAVIEDTASAIAGVVTAKIYPALTVNLTSSAVTFADVSAGGHVANLAFVKDAFAFVTRPLELPRGAGDTFVASYNGLSMRVCIGYNQTTKVQEMSVDVLYGYAPLYPELATRILG